MTYSFTILSKDSLTRARLGIINTNHGSITTPVFMPVGTQGTVKSITPLDLESIGVEIVLGNAYHLYLRPGIKVIQDHGGLHKFMGWSRPILTDSGGFQIMSLSRLVNIDYEGATFRSHIDGSLHFLRPEDIMTIQKCLGTDIAVCLDECVKFPATYERAKASTHLSLDWAKRCRDFDSGDIPVFGIIQGGIYKDLRQLSATGLVEMDFDGYAIGGLSVGEDTKDTYDIIDFSSSLLPEDKPRYVMGIGTPFDIFEAVSNGIDMMDCVIPTRSARNGLLYTKRGEVIIKHARYTNDLTPLDPDCRCYTCRHFTKSYLRHLYMSKEVLSCILNTIHNITFYIEFIESIRNAIRENRLAEFKEAFKKNYMDSKECSEDDTTVSNVSNL